MAEALGTRWTDDLSPERDAVVAALGPESAERAVGVIATFQMMNRLLDGVGAPVGSQHYSLAMELGFQPEDISR